MNLDEKIVSILSEIRGALYGIIFMMLLCTVVLSSCIMAHH